MYFVVRAGFKINESPPFLLKYIILPVNYHSCKLPIRLDIIFIIHSLQSVGDILDLFQDRLGRVVPSPGRATAAILVSQSVFTITENDPTRAFCWLKAPTSAFTFKTLLRHDAKWALTPRSLNVKLGRDTKVIRDGRFG